MVAVLTERRTITRVTLRCVPLTPLHVGDGTTLSLDEYLIEGQELCRFDPLSALRKMPKAERTRFSAALDRGELARANDALRAAGRSVILERIPLSQRSAQELKTAIGHPESRSGTVHPFIRSAGRPYIPGSSVKGAFRTALMSDRLPRERFPTERLTHEQAVQAAFSLDPADTSTDPLRFLSVSDAPLPAGATMIDRPEVFHPGKPDAGKMQMHYEILPGRAIDPKDRTAFEVVLLLDSRLDIRGRLSRAELFRATSRFHWAIWQGERARFFRPFPKTIAAMDEMLRKITLGSGGTAAEHGLDSAPNYVLLRLGRFGHFESKSLEGVRRDHDPQAKDPTRRIRQPNAWGATRTVLRRDGDAPIPFGWVLGWLTKEETL